jgi:DsbC/DsbD-like thiol-disulfide interchange protein
MTHLKLCCLTVVVVFVFHYSNSAQTVTGSISKGAVKRGVTARGSIVLSLPNELHVNSNRPGSEYLIPTEINLSSKRGVRVGRVKYPRGHDRKFQFTTKILNVYEGRTVFPFTVTVPTNYRGRSITVRANVEFQACTDEVCYPPRKEVVTMTARVR